MKARKVFEQYPDANWLAMDADKCVCLSVVEPITAIGKNEWYIKDKFWFINLYVINIDEFQDKPWTDCKISREEAMRNYDCKYCCSKGKSIMYLGGGGFGTDYNLFIIKNKLVKREDYGEITNEVKINYCPFCGRRFED